MQYKATRGLTTVACSQRWGVYSTKPLWRALVSSQHVQPCKLIMNSCCQEWSSTTLTSIRIWAPILLAWVNSQTQYCSRGQLRTDTNVLYRCHQLVSIQIHADLLLLITCHWSQHWVIYDVAISAFPDLLALAASVLSFWCILILLHTWESTATSWWVWDPVLDLHSIWVNHISSWTSKPESSFQAPNRTSQQQNASKYCWSKIECTCCDRIHCWQRKNDHAKHQPCEWYISHWSTPPAMRKQDSSPDMLSAR